MELEHNNGGRKYRRPTDSAHVRGQRSRVESELEQTPLGAGFCDWDNKQRNGSIPGFGKTPKHSPMLLLMQALCEMECSGVQE